jgi:hypothetical protein
MEEEEGLMQRRPSALAEDDERAAARRADRAAAAAVDAGWAAEPVHVCVSSLFPSGCSLHTRRRAAGTHARR